MDISHLIDGLNAPEVTVRRGAAERLALAPQVAAAVALARASGDADEQVREWAVAALEELGAPDVGDVAALAGLLGDHRTDVRYWSATLLGRLREQAASAVGALSRTLDEDPELAVRQRAAWSLGRIGPAAEAARQTLKEAARAGDARLARLAMEALEKLGEP